MESNVLKDLVVVKRSGQRVSFNGAKIAIAIKSAFEDTYEVINEKDINSVYETVLTNIIDNYKDRKTINVEDIQDIIESNLNKEKYKVVYKSFSEYRLRRAASREAFNVKQTHKFVKAVEKIGLTARMNNYDKPNELINSFGKTISSEFALSYLIENKSVRAHDEGLVYINDIDSYSLGTISSANINISSLNKNSLNEFFIDLSRFIDLCKNDVYEELLISDFDTILRELVINEYKELLLKEFIKVLKIKELDTFIDINTIKNTISQIDNLYDKKEFNNQTLDLIYLNVSKIVIEDLKIILNNYFKLLLNKTFNNKIIVISLNNYSDSTSIFINKIYLDISKKNITNIYIKDSSIEIIEAITNSISNGDVIHLINSINRKKNYFSNGELVYKNINDEEALSLGRTINAKNTINLCRLALKSNNKESFYSLLDDYLEIAKNSLIQRYEVIANKFKNSYNIIFNGDYLFDSTKLEDNQKVRKVIRNGTLFIGYSGLIESVMILNKKDNSIIDSKDYTLIDDILKYISKKCEQYTKNEKLNFMICEIYDNNILKELIKIDKSVYGLINILNKNSYEPMYKFIKDYDVFSKYQKDFSSIYKIKLKKKIKEEIINIINSDLIYIEVKNDS